MPDLLPSTALGRVSLHRRFLTLCLFLREGLFWDAVKATRAAWGIGPVNGMPTYPVGTSGLVEGFSTICVPTTWPAKAPVSPLRPRYPNGDGFEMPSLVIALQLPREWGRCGLGWWVDVKRLHDWFVPEDCRSLGPIPERTWAPFMSMCVTHDPPKDRLLEFAEAPPVLIDFAPTPVGKDPQEPPDVSGPGMVHPPIVTVRDGDDVEDAYLEMNEDVFHRLALEVSGQGIDLFAVRERIAREEPWLFERHRERLRAVRKGHFIAVRPETTKADVIAAFDLIKRELPSEESTRRRSAKTKSDPLTCVQCAVWYDECGKTHGDIAARFGWELQHDRTLNQWSETARAHIARGRKILRSDPETRQSMILGQK